jgi:hypothetical protein
MRSQLSRFALWVAASQFILFSPFVEARHGARMAHSDFHDRRASKDIWPIDGMTSSAFLHLVLYNFSYTFPNV